MASAFVGGLAAAGGVRPRRAASGSRVRCRRRCCGRRPAGVAVAVAPGVWVARPSPAAGGSFGVWVARSLPLMRPAGLRRARRLGRASVAGGRRVLRRLGRAFAAVDAASGSTARPAPRSCVPRVPRALPRRTCRLSRDGRPAACMKRASTAPWTRWMHGPAAPSWKSAAPSGTRAMSHASRGVADWEPAGLPSRLTDARRRDSRARRRRAGRVRRRSGPASRISDGSGQLEHPGGLLGAVLELGRRPDLVRRELDQSL